MAMYSKKLSVPPGASNRLSLPRSCSTNATEKLLSGKPETITSIRPILRQLLDAGVMRA